MANEDGTAICLAFRRFWLRAYHGAYKRVENPEGNRWKQVQKSSKIRSIAEEMSQKYQEGKKLKQGSREMRKECTGFKIKTQVSHLT